MSDTTRKTSSLFAGALVAAVALPLLSAPAASAAPAPTATTVKSSTSTVDRDQRASRSARAAVFTKKVNTKASSLKGVPYRYGGTTPRGFDCSGYAQYVYRSAGVSIPRTASAQRAATTRISRSQARPGDLVFFHRSGTTRAYHVGIYAGGNQLWHAPMPGQRVKKANIWTSKVTFGRPKGL